MLNGPWLFRNRTMILMEYDGFMNPRSVSLEKKCCMARVLKLPDNYLNDAVIKGMCRKMRKIVKVQIQLQTGYVGPFVHVKVNLDVNKKIRKICFDY